MKDIYNFHAFEFLPELENREKEWYHTQAPTLCDIFLRHMNKIKLHELFIDNLKEAVRCIDSTIQAQPLFRTCIKEIDTKVKIIQFRANHIISR